MTTSFAPCVVAAVLLGAVVSAGCQHTDRSAASTPSGEVTVEFREMERFTDFDDGPTGYGKTAGDYAAVIKRIVAEEARRRLPVGQELSVTFTNIDLAGDLLPSMKFGLTPVRVIEDHYPAHIDLSFTLTDANGAVLKHGERSLSDRGFEVRMFPGPGSPLNYERELLRDWLRSELG